MNSSNICFVKADKDFEDIATATARLFDAKFSCVAILNGDKVQIVKQSGLFKVTSDVDEFFQRLLKAKDVEVIEDAHNGNFFKSSTPIKETSNFRFYAGVVIRSKDDRPVGLLSVFDSTTKRLSDTQLYALRALGACTAKLLDSENFNNNLEKQQRDFFSILNFSNPFFLLIDKDGFIKKCGRSFNIIYPKIRPENSFYDYFFFKEPFNYEKFLNSEKLQTKSIFFFDSKNAEMRFRFSALKWDGQILLLTSPVINSNYHIKNYNGLSLKDFPAQDYISDYIFLLETTDISAKESKSALASMVDKNNELRKVQTDLYSIARLPAENPDPIVRLRHDFSLEYHNEAASKSFLADFHYEEGYLLDPELQFYIDRSVKEESTLQSFTLKRNNKTYKISLKHIPEFQFINVYASDITDHIKKLEESEIANIRCKNFYEFILNNIPADIAVFDPNHKYLFVNPNGISSEEVRKFIVGKDDFDYCRYKKIPEDLAIARRKRFKKAIETGAFVEWVDSNRGKDGEIRHILRKLYPVIENGEILFVIGYGVDVTEIKRKELEIFELNRNLESKVKIRTQQLETKNNDLEGFVYAISHDLRSPLRMVNSYASILLERVGDMSTSRQDQMLKSIKQYSLNMNSIITDLLQLSKIGAQELSKTKNSLNEIVEVCIAELKNGIHEGKFNFVVSDLGEVFCDKGLMKIAIYNLLSNAVKYSSKVARPEIEISRFINENNQVVYFVKDNGAGFNSANASRLFKPFQRMHSKDEFEGTGVGLSIVHAIMTKHGGSVWANSRENEGAVFYFTLG